MTSDAVAQLLVAVEAAFADTGRGLDAWPDPHPDRMPTDDEYSRVTDPERMRITSARAEAWTVALVEHELADVEQDATVEWRELPGTRITRTDRLVPVAAAALPLVLARSEIGGVGDAGMTIGIGDPAVLITLIPDCGCDACDSGSDDLLIELDELMIAVVTGRYRHLRRGESQVTVLGDRTSGSNVPSGMRGVEQALADSSGWDELTGRTWFGG